MAPRGPAPIFQVSEHNAHEGDTTMLTETKMALVAALILRPPSPALAAGPADQSGARLPGSLYGGEPAGPPAIFGNPATARSYDFVQSQDGAWHVQGNSHQGTN